MRILRHMRFVNPAYPLSELTRDVIAGFYRSYDAFGFGFREAAYRRTLALVLFSGPKPQARRVIRDDRRDYPIVAR